MAISLMRRTSPVIGSVNILVSRFPSIYRIELQRKTYQQTIVKPFKHECLLHAKISEVSKSQSFMNRCHDQNQYKQLTATKVHYV